MPDSNSQVWVDATFMAEQAGKEDLPVKIQLANNENIGSYSIPILYTTEEPSEDDVDVVVQYFSEITSVSGLENVPGEYFAYKSPLISGVETTLVEFTGKQNDQLFDKDTDVVYTTGFNSVSGTFNKTVVFSSPVELLSSDNVATVYRTIASTSGISYWWANYTNFSGDLDPDSGLPIPFHYGSLSYPAVYGDEGGATDGFFNKIVEVSFAGWVHFPILSDVYSALLGTKFGYETTATVISGSVDPHYLDIMSSILVIDDIRSDLFCSLVDYQYINNELEVIKGRLGPLYGDIYSVIEEKVSIRMNIDLLSLKISNFSLDEGEFTTASGFLCVDITDDECLVSTSGTYFMVDGSAVPTTFYEIEDGYRICYNSADNFGSLEGPTTFTVHAENECGKVLEIDYYLVFGYFVEYENNSGFIHGTDFGFDNLVAVRITAENYASCPQLGAFAWDFESSELRNTGLGASITGVAFGSENKDLSAQIFPKSTAYFYGKNFRVVVKAKDFAGNEMEPFVLEYRIENKPS